MMDFRKSNNARYVTFGSETEVKGRWMYLLQNE